MQRGEQLMEPCEGQLHLRLDADRPHRMQTRRGPDQLINKRALADTRLAPDKQGAALPRLHRPREPLEDRDLARSANVVHRPPRAPTKCGMQNSHLSSGSAERAGFEARGCASIHASAASDPGYPGQASAGRSMLSRSSFRELMFNLVNTFRRCHSTVRALMNN